MGTLDDPFLAPFFLAYFGGSRLMPAYVFWHWPKPNTNREAYEGWLSAFHATLAREPPPGFLRSAVFRLARTAWLPQSGYETGT